MAGAVAVEVTPPSTVDVSVDAVPAPITVTVGVPTSVAVLVGEDASAAQAAAEAYADARVAAEASRAEAAEALLAPLASPTFTGSPTAPTPSTGDSSTKVATTALVAAKITALGLGTASTHAATDFDAAGAAAAAQSAAIAAAATDATTKANNAVTTAEGYADTEVSAEVTRADGAYVAKTGGTMSGALGVPELDLAGKNGLFARNFSGRLDIPGPPAVGTWNVDDEVQDSLGSTWRCSEAGTPGTWDQITSGYAQITARKAILNPLSMYGAAAVATWFTANAALFQRFDVEIGGLYRYVNIETGTQSGNMAVAVVALSGNQLSSYTKVMGTGVIAVPASGSQRFDLGTTYLPPGPYALVVWYDNTTAAINQLNSSRLNASLQTVIVTGLSTGIPASGSVGAWGAARALPFVLEADLTNPASPLAAITTRRAAWVATLSSPLPAGVTKIGWDDFQRSDRNLQGDYAPTGQRYTHGGQNPVIRSKVFDANDPTLFGGSGSAILYQPESVVPKLIVAEFIFKAGASTGHQNAVIGGCQLGFGSPATPGQTAVSLQLAAYAVNEPGGSGFNVNLFYVPNPITDPYPNLLTETIPAFTVDGATHYWMALGVDVPSSTATIWLPDGSVHQVTDPAVATAWGPKFGSQMRRPLSTDGSVVFSYIEASA